MVAVFEVCMRTLLGRIVEKHPQKKYVLETSREVGAGDLQQKGDWQGRREEAQDGRSSQEVLKITGKVILNYKKY